MFWMPSARIDGRGLAFSGAVLLALSLWPAFLHAAGPTIKEEFPRLGGVQIGSNPYPEGYNDPAYQSAMAKLDFVLLGGKWDMNDVARAIKDENPDIVLAKYTHLWQLHQNEDSYSVPLFEKLASERGPNDTNAFDWYARDAEGNRIIRSPGTWAVNHTDYVRPDANGDRWPEFRAKYDYDWYFYDDVWDFWYGDEVWWRVREFEGGGYPDYAGTPLSTDERNAAFRRGHNQHWQAIRELVPDIMIMANSADWHRHEDDLGRRDIPEYDGQIEGGLLERIMREDKPKAFDTVMLYYRRQMSYLIEPKVLLFVVEGLPDNYQFFRYSFATCLMGNAFFEYVPYEYYYGTVEWFDEFDLAGQADTSWMGRAVSAPQEAPWQEGVYRRDFEHAVALVNPAGNGPRTVQLEPGLSRIAGVQDPAFNNGQSVSQITLEDGDGIILVRDGVLDPPTVPMPPIIEVR